MSDSDLNVLHVVGSDTPAARLETLAALLAGRDAGASARAELGRQRVVQLGGDRVDTSGLGTVERLAAPLGIGWLASRCLRSVIPVTGRTVVHIWSPRALNWVAAAVRSDERLAAPGAGVNYRLLMDVEVPFDFRRLARGFSRRWSVNGLQFVCSTEAVRRRLLGAGVAPGECVVIRDAVDFAAIDAARRSDVRPRLGLSEAHAVVLVLPPVLRETGGLVAAWAAMLLEEVRPGVRLVVPGEGRETDRVRWLVKSCRHERMLRLAGRRFGLAELLSAADVAVYLPAGDAPLSGVVWALAAGRPVVASAVPATAELLAAGQNAWLCRAEDPREAARRLLRALENRGQSQRQVTLARAQVLEGFSRGRMIARYARAYENLLADRWVAEGIEEAGLSC